MAENLNENVYFLVNSGEVLYTSFEKNDVEYFQQTRLTEDYDDAQNELGISDPNEKHENDIAFLATYNSGDYKMYRIKYSKLKEAETVCVDDEEFSSSDILAKLKCCTNNDIF